MHPAAPHGPTLLAHLLGEVEMLPTNTQGLCGLVRTLDVIKWEKKGFPTIDIFQIRSWVRVACVRACRSCSLFGLGVLRTVQARAGASLDPAERAYLFSIKHLPNLNFPLSREVACRRLRR